jgi:ATP-dependent helicase HrpA
VAGLPDYLKMRYQVTDGGRVLATGRDLDELRDRLRPELTAALSQAAAGITRTGLTTWDMETLPEVFTNGQVRGYPALADAGSTVDVRVFDTEAEAAQAMKAGTARLILLAVPSGVRSIASRLPMNLKMAMSRHPYPSAAAMLDDCAFAAALRVVEDAGGPARDQAGFGRLVEAARDRLAPDTARVLEAVSQILTEAQEVEIRLTQANPVPALAPAFEDMRRQFAALVYPGFIARTGRRLPDVIRYLRATVRRLDKLAGEQARDAERMAVVHRVEAEYLDALAEQPGRDLEAVRWMIEELRVNLFAQVLGTPFPVSEKRILTALEQIAALE